MAATIAAAAGSPRPPGKGQQRSGLVVTSRALLWYQIALHARLTDETRRFIGREHFDLMKPTAYFINNARSRMVRCDDLYEVLQEGRIAGAALDVHDDEPLGKDSPWLELENVTLTPHIAGTTTDTWENSVRLVAEAVKEFAETGGASNTVNAEALEKT
jgi:D-3-phosphoglycerate dehydrogenase